MRVTCCLAACRVGVRVLRFHDCVSGLISACCVSGMCVLGLTSASCVLGLLRVGFDWPGPRLYIWYLQIVCVCIYLYGCIDIFLVQPPHRISFSMHKVSHKLWKSLAPHVS